MIIWYEYFIGNHYDALTGHLFEIKIFCNIINVFTVIFNTFNLSLLNKSVIFLNNKTAPKPLNGQVCSFS